MAKIETIEIPQAHRFTHRAMATTFEVFVIHPERVFAEQAAYAAFEKVDRLEQELSRYIANSDISKINNQTTDEPLRVGLATFDCLRISKRLHKDTNGAFDVTIGPLFACWFDENKKPRTPSEEEIREARRRVGMNRVELDRKRHTVRLPRGPVGVDLGGIGKGYAVDRMAALLRDWDVDRALIHGGFSSVRALDGPEAAKAWPLTLRTLEPTDSTMMSVQLRNRALGASGLHKGRHIIDPRTGRPAAGNRAAWVCAPTATEADALSTAFMVMSPKEIRRCCERHPGVAAMVLEESAKHEKRRVVRYGDWSVVNLQEESVRKNED